jgi:2-iminobutanoate/2-iminopropanoate deaminase
MLSRKIALRTERAPGPLSGAPLSQSIRYGGLIYTSGQIGVNVETGKLPEGGIGPETEQLLENIKAILEDAGSGLDKLLKVTVVLAERDDWATMNEVYKRYIGGEAPPARTTFSGATIAMNARVEMDCIAFVAES